MNLFALSSDPKICAVELDDKRLNKIVTESAQIICTILADDGIDNLPFKSTHESHPIVKWVGDTHQALYWTLSYHLALVQEWKFRFGKSHASGLVERIVAHIPQAKAPKAFQNSARNELRGFDFTWIDDVHLAYRMYLNARWFNDTITPKWTKRNPPTWFEQAPFDDFSWSLMLINRAKELIGKQRDGHIACPRCGHKLTFKSASDFLCTSNNQQYVCLKWQVLKA